MAKFATAKFNSHEVVIVKIDFCKILGKAQIAKINFGKMLRKNS